MPSHKILPEADGKSGNYKLKELFITEGGEMIITFEVLGEPVAKGRPKFFRRGNYTGTYTPPKTEQAEYDFKVQSLKYKPAKLIEEAITLDIVIYRSIPKSMSKKKRQLINEGKLFPITRPDCDNYGKLVMDAMNKIFWKDDSQIVKLDIKKYYSDNPKIKIALMWKEDVDEVEIIIKGGDGSEKEKER